jgi:hypothetical protein
MTRTRVPSKERLLDDELLDSVEPQSIEPTRYEKKGDLVWVLPKERFYGTMTGLIRANSRSNQPIIIVATATQLGSIKLANLLFGLVWEGNWKCIRTHTDMNMQ